MPRLVGRGTSKMIEEITKLLLTVKKQEDYMMLLRSNIAYGRLKK